MAVLPLAGFSASTTQLIKEVPPACWQGEDEKPQKEIMFSLGVETAWKQMESKQAFFCAVVPASVPGPW